VTLIKKPTFCFIDPLYSLFDFDLIDPGPDLYYFSPSAALGFGLVFF
jgi:hypothetical protein